MRYFSIALIALFFASDAGAQSGMPKATDREEQPIKSPTQADVYFLIDATGSVSETEYRNIGRRVSEHVKYLPTDAWISVTYFGAQPKNGAEIVECEERLELNPPQPKDSWVYEPPQQGSDKVKSAIGRALETAMSQANSDSDAKIVLFTDGIEECHADFIGIRNQYPNPEVRVELIPTDSKQALEKIQNVVSPNLGVPLKPIDGSAAPSFTFDFSHNTKGDDIEKDPWTDANWIEKYLWFICFVLMAVSAIALGRKYDQLSVAIRRKTQDWQDQLAEQLKNRNEPPKNSVEPLDLKNLKNRKEIYDCHGWFIGSIVLAAPLFLSLSMVDGIHEMETEYGLPILVACGLLPVLFSTSLATLAAEHQKLPSWLQTIIQPFDRSVHWKIVVGAGLFATLLASIFCIDLSDAKSAAWFVLSSEFATALAVLATAPFLFFGACWLEYQRSFQTNVIVETQTMSAEVRANEQAKQRFTNLQNAFDSLVLSLTSRTEQVQKGRARSSSVPRKVKREIEAYAKKLIWAEVERQSTPTEKADLIDRFIVNSANASFFREIAKLTGVDDDTKDKLKTLADALDGDKTEVINSALESLYRGVVQPLKRTR